MVLSKRNMKERLEFVRFWANYIKTHNNKEWSRQQALLVNSILKSANKDPELYMKVKSKIALKSSSSK